MAGERCVISYWPGDLVRLRSATPIPRKPPMRSAQAHVRQFDAYAFSYEETLQRGLRYSGESSTYFARGRVLTLAQRLRDLGEAPRVVLDFGCGAGSGTILLAELLGAERAIGVDVSSQFISIARTRHNHAGVEFHLRALARLRDVDCAYSNGVFHHIAPSERHNEVAYLFAALRPGGLFALCENNPWNPGTRLVMRSIAFDRDAVPVAAPEARHLLRAGGFEVLSSDFLFVFPRPARALRRTERYLRRWPIGAQYMVLARKPNRPGDGVL